MIKKALTHSGITGLFGQRQVGKTTLLEDFSKEHKTFDHAQELALATERADVFIDQRKAPFGIDEAQLCPPLFPALKDKVKQNRKPGLYLLSGSVRFTSRKAIRESLTGRIVGVEILPFTISEAHDRKLPAILKAISTFKKSAELLQKIDKMESSKQEFERYLITGGLPGICFYRDQQVRSQRFEFQVDTILSRDYQLVHETTLPISSLRALLTYIAIHQGESINLKEAGEFSRISKATIQKVLNTFEALFLIRELSAHPKSGEVKSAYFFEDQGMASWLTKNHLHSEQYDLVRCLYANMRQELFYEIGDIKNISFFRTKNGVNVPLVFAVGTKYVGIIPTNDHTPSAKIYAAAESFNKAVPHSIAVIASSNSEVRVISPKMIEVPYWKLV